MISDIKKGTYFKGVIEYVEKKIEQGKGHYIGDNFNSQDRSDRIGFLTNIASERPNLKKKVFHVSLSLPAGERMSDQQWQKAADHYMKGMGFENAPYCITRHTDTEKDHIHIVASRVDYNGQTISDSLDRQRSMDILREMEILFGLQRVQSKKVKKSLGMSRQEIHAQRRGEPLEKTKLRKVVEQALEKTKDLSEFEKMLPNAKVHRYRNGKAYGISFEYQGKAFKGSQLGKGYSLKQIELRLEKQQEHKRKMEKAKEVGKELEKRMEIERKQMQRKPEQTPRKDRGKDFGRGMGMNF